VGRFGQPVGVLTDAEPMLTGRWLDRAGLEVAPWR
jgi:hypothetical protein